MKKSWLFFALLLSCCQMLAQPVKTVAVFTNATRTSPTTPAPSIEEDLLTKLTKNTRMNFIHYSYRIMAKKIGSFAYNSLRNTDKKEAPADYLFFNVVTGSQNNKPRLEIKTDTLNNIQKAYYKLSFESKVKYKIVDFKTSEIVAMGAVISDKYAKDKQTTANIVEVKDFEKYFGKNLGKLKSKEIAEARKKVRKDYDKKIKGVYQKALNEAKKNNNILPRLIAGLVDDTIYELVDAELLKGKKIKDFFVDAKEDKSVKKNDQFLIYEVMEFADGTVTSLLANSRVIDLEKDRFKMQTYAFQRKKLATAFSSGKKLLLVRNANAIEEMNTLDKENYRISLDKSCLWCEYDLEKMLTDLASVTLIERANKGCMTYLLDRYKSEQFIDFQMADYQSKQEGVQIVLSRVNRTIQLTEIETGRVIDTEVKAYGNRVTMALLEHSGAGIKLLSIEKQKKNKITEMLVYHPFGFSLFDVIELNEVLTETVGGKALKRNKKVGKGSIRRIKSPNVGVLKIADGKKDIFEVVNRKAVISFQPIIRGKK